MSGTQAKIEIQAKTCAEVAGFSAKYAADKLGCPVLKSDSGLYIEVLGGLPGPYSIFSGGSTRRRL